MKEKMKHQCGREDIINYDIVLGSGTHGVVYASRLNHQIAVKIFNIDYCNIAENVEYVLQELAHNSLKKHRHMLDECISSYIHVPQVYGFMYLPDSMNIKCCMYYMDRVFSTDNFNLGSNGNNLIQLAFNYNRDYDETLSSGRYMGIDVLRKICDCDIIIKAVATLMALFHYGAKIDAYDVEFVLNYNNHVVAIDFDKVNQISYIYPYHVKRKLTESDYDTFTITNDKDLARFLAKSVMYCPHIAYPEYQMWKDAYLDTATIFDHYNFATQVMDFYERYF